MFKRKQWASAVRRGRKHVIFDEDTASPEGRVVKDKDELGEGPSGRCGGETNKKNRIRKRTRRRKKGDCCSADVTSYRPSPPEEFSDSDIDLNCSNEKEKQHCAHSYNPSSALLTTTTSMPMTSIVPSRCCRHGDKDTSKYNYDECSSLSSMSSSGSLSSPSHSLIHSSSSPDGRRKKRGKHNKKNKRAGRNWRHRRPHQVGKKEGKGRGWNCFSKRTKRRINFMAAAGIKLLIALLTTQL